LRHPPFRNAAAANPLLHFGVPLMCNPETKYKIPACSVPVIANVDAVITRSRIHVGHKIDPDAEIGDEFYSDVNLHDRNTDADITRNAKCTTT
jgi:hypothetical protein